jgi:hypothetical protein
MIFTFTVGYVMSKNPPKNFRQVQEEYKDVVVGLCCVCSKPVKGWYGANDKGGTCNKTCEEEHAKLPRYPGHSYEEYMQRQAT